MEERIKVTVFVVVMSTILAIAFWYSVLQPEFHAFDMSFGDGGSVSFNLQNMGTGAATNIFVNISIVFSVEDDDFKLFANKTIDSLQSGEVRRYSADVYAKPDINMEGGKEIWYFYENETYPSMPDGTALSLKCNIQIGGCGGFVIEQLEGGRPYYMIKALFNHELTVEQKFLLDNIVKMDLGDISSVKYFDVAISCAEQVSEEMKIYPGE